MLMNIMKQIKMKHLRFSTKIWISLYIFTIYLVIYKRVNNSYCGSYIPYSQGTCDSFTNDTYICCYLSGKYEGYYFNQCYPFERKEYYKLTRTIYFNGYEFSLDCGKGRGALCGDVVNPVSYQDCGIYSTKGNSCCFYKYKTTTNCVWLGSPDIGTFVDTKANITVICSMNFIKMNILVLLSLIFLLF